MAEVRRQVERIIESDPTIRMGLQRGIINSRALSRYILENCAVDSTQDAVLGILRRYPLEGGRDADHRLALRDCNISMRGGMAYLTLEYTPDVMKRVAEFTSTIRANRGDNFRVVVGSNSVRVMARQEALDTFAQSFRQKEIISHYDSLAEVCLLLPHGAEKLGEIATAITAQLTLNGVGLFGILVAPPEDIIIVSEIDASRTFESLQQLLRDETRSPSRKSAGFKESLPKLDKLLAIAKLDDSIMNPTLMS